MMKVIIAAIAFTFAACASSPQPVVNSNASSAATNAQRSERSETVIAHSTESRTAPGSDSVTAAAPKTKWTQSGDPIDTKELDAAIAAAQKELRSNSSEPSAKKAMADAYLKRAVALTDARQYASALGDYRRVLKYDPENAEAKNWIEQIIGIYSSLGRESPKEGEEPPPLPFKG
jgi:tetratricopeptide (TPR) repeat protein